MKKNNNYWLLKKMAEKRKNEVQRAIRPPHNYTLNGLKSMSFDGFIFLQLIISNRWMECQPTGDREYDEKLRFIREWYESRNPPSRVQDEPMDDFL